SPRGNFGSPGRGRRAGRRQRVPVGIALLLPLLAAVAGLSLQPGRMRHLGVCPNQLNPNLWVDAQSTCERECQTDQVSDGTAGGGRVSLGGCPQVPQERCFGPVPCGTALSVVSVQHAQPGCSSSPKTLLHPSPTAGHTAWPRYPICVPQECSHTDKGNRCAGTGPPTLGSGQPSPILPLVSPESIPHPWSGMPVPVPPALYSNPFHQSVRAGGTVSFRCDVSGRPRPDITWEKQSEREENFIMRPDQMYGNVVVTNIGQLVIYNARHEDAGIYTCTARNSAGLLRADFPLSVLRREPGATPRVSSPQPFPSAECLKEPDRRRCEALEVRWHFDAKQGACLTFRYGGCGANRNHFETYEECRAACLGSARPTCLLPMVQGPCQNWEPRWAYNHLLKQCHSFVYGGCEGNTNNFESKETCEDVCPFPKSLQCKACRLKSKMVLSLCRSDFAIVGRLMEIVEDQDSGIARFALEDVLKDEKMGLKFFNIKYLEVTLTDMDWSCPCPNMTAEDGPLIIMGEVHDGMATLDPNSYVRAANDKRVKKIYELMEKKTCDLLNRFQD
ncbi:WFKN1 protein, partial [Columbina picui]|nr:WFKN1 protein [Columbina picui]